jgi:hypothetical protein
LAASSKLQFSPLLSHLNVPFYSSAARACILKQGQSTLPRSFRIDQATSNRKNSQARRSVIHELESSASQKEEEDALQRFRYSSDSI